MKKILVPLDFSEISLHALRYAVQLAKYAGAHLELLHVCHSGELPAIDITSELILEKELKEEASAELEKLKRKTLKNHPGLHIGYACVAGIPTEEINRYASEHAIDLIILGAQGKGFLEERFLGSTATSVIKHAPAAVLTIPEKLRFRRPKNMVFAVDFIETRPQVLKPLKEMARLFGSEIFILNIVQESVVSPSMKEMIAAYQLDQALKNIHHTFFYLHRDNIVKGINEFVSDYHMDLVVMIPHSHSFFSRILKEPVTKQMAFHSKVPLLTLQSLNK